MKKIIRALAATAVLAVIFPLLPASQASANSTLAIGSTFEEAAFYSPATGRHFNSTPALAVDDEGNIYTASVSDQNQSMFNVRQLGVDQMYGVGRGSHPGNNLVITKVNKDGEVQWVWELRAVEGVGGETHGWWRDIAVAPDGTVHVAGWYRGLGHAWYWQPGDDPRESTLNNEGGLVDGDWIMPEKFNQINGQWIAVNPDGTTKWIKQLHSTGASYFHSVDVNDQGDVLLAGRYTGWTRFNMNQDPSSSNLWTERCRYACPYITKHLANGSNAWSHRYNHCNKPHHSGIWDAKFLKDGRVAAVGGYTGTPIWQCKTGGSSPSVEIKGAYSANSIGYTPRAVSVDDGLRSYMAFFNGNNGSTLYAREFGATEQLSNATAIAQHPVTEDLFIAGLWEDSKQNCFTGDDWYFAPTKPSTLWPNVDHSVFTRPNKTIKCSEHERTSGTAGQHVPNQDTYVLHTDKHGNYKNVEVFDIHLEKEHRPHLDINSDGSEIAISNTAYPTLIGNNAYYRQTGDIPTPGANGWVMTLDTADLSQNWLSINEANADWPDDGGHSPKQYSWTRDVAYGPDGKVHVSGRTQYSTKFGETVDGTAAIHDRRNKATQDAWVARFNLDGLIDNGAPPEVPCVAEDGYSAIVCPVTQDDDGSFLIGYGGEVVLDTPLCLGGRWQVTPQPGIAIRQYMVLKDHLTDDSGAPVAPADAIRTYHSSSLGTVPNYNILWQDGYILDADGGSAGPVVTSPELFKVLGWDEGVDDLDVSTQLPVGFYFRHNMFVYSPADVNPDNPSAGARYQPFNEINGHTWDRDDYEVFLAFAHPAGSTNDQPYPLVETVCPTVDAGFTVSKKSIATDEKGASESFTVRLDTKPSTAVKIVIANTDTTEVSVNKDVLWFYPYNWNTTQTVTATGLDDNEPDGDVTSYINVSVVHDESSYEFATLTNQLVDVLNTNDDLLPPPPDPDIDGDGILNENEVDGCVEDPDCDDDGINDNNEIPACILVADCDGDGTPDNQEQDGCIQDPRCTDNNNDPVSDDPPDKEPLEPVKPDDPPTPDPPPIIEPDEDNKPQPETDLGPDDQDDVDTGNIDSDGDGVPDEEEPPGCESTIDCDGDGILDGDDPDPSDPDSDSDGLPDGFDPDPSNPDSDGDGISDGEDPDSDGNGIPDDQEQGIPGSGFAPTDEPSNTPGASDGSDGSDGSDEAGSDSADNAEGAVQTPQATPGVSSSGTGFIDAIGDLPPAAIAAAALVAAVGLAATAASLAGPSLLSWLLRGALGIWIFGLLFGRRGVRCDVCDALLVKRDGVWVDKDNHWRVGINEHIHVPADFSDKDRAKYLNSLK